MYTELGKNKIVASKDVVAIFDLDNSSQSHITRKYLAAADRAGQVVNAAEDIPKSFVVTERKGKKKLYLSQMAVSTLLKRAETKFM